jgi:NAD(P)-dependent dehydrogenase (short-subunit alcohol dehydrogenase family)
MSKHRFTNKIALITGGNSGMGLASAKAYAREGAKVAITGRDQKTLDAAAKEIGPGTLAIKADVSNVSEIEKAMAAVGKEFGRIDALFVNAGIGKFIPMEQVTEAFFDGTMDINVKGLFFTVQKALPFLGKGSAVLLNASINARLAMPNSTVYSASKAAVVSLGKTIAAELVGRGVRVNVLSPGPIETPIFGRMGMPAEELKGMRDWIRGAVPMKRFGTSEEIADAVLFLTSEEASFITGSELVVDGGMATLK